MSLATDGGPGTYRAGACNIGPEEIAQRRRLGVVELFVALGLAIGLVVAGTPAWTRIAVWPILAGAFVTLEQVRRRFCVAFGFAGIRNFGPLGRVEHVDDDADRAIDRRAALVLTLYCSIAAAVLTAAFVVLPR